MPVSFDELGRHSGLLELIADPLGRASDIALMGRDGADTWNSKKGLEFVDEAARMRLKERGDRFHRNLGLTDGVLQNGAKMLQNAPISGPDFLPKPI
jgi:hypothetical protein